MNHEQMLRRASEVYSHCPQPAANTVKPFPAPPGTKLPPEEFVDCLLQAALESSPKLLHPFSMRLGRGECGKDQLGEWVRQDYQRTICLIRRHALLAANCTEYELLWSLLTRVKTEADADPVGGTFFALPQLWTKFGIALGLSRGEVIRSQPHPLLALLNEAMLCEARFSAVLPVSELVDAILDPIFYRLWGEALEKSLGLSHDAFDFFWAIAADRWGTETGRSILLGWAGTHEAQTALWRRYASEAAQGREWHRFALLETVVAPGADRSAVPDVAQAGAAAPQSAARAGSAKKPGSE